jgi:hypothetical protein
MVSKNTELYFDVVSQGSCDVQGCGNPARYRASWAQGVVMKLVCPAHRTAVEGKLFEDLGSAVFGNKPRINHNHN